MLTGSNIIAGVDSTEGDQVFQAFDPTANALTGPTFHNATANEVKNACTTARQAFEPYRQTSRAQRADFLYAIAEEIEAIAETLTQRATQETALPPARLNGERARTCNQMRLYADHVREGAYLSARIDHAQPNREPLPKPDMRRMFVPIGPVAVFGASNFPLAYSVAGGDTASALAAGCPVVVKAHPAHPGTSELVARAINHAVKRCKLHPGVFSLVHGGVETGQTLVTDPSITGVGFTGSLRAGRALFDLANARPVPIPVFAEMGSVNPVFVLPGAVQQRADDIAKTLAASVTVGVGQFCTNPGLVLGLKGTGFEQLVENLAALVGATPPGTMLTPTIAESYRAGLAERSTLRINPPTASTASGCQVAPEVFQVTGERFLAEPHLAEELFGPTTLAVHCDTLEQLLEIAGSVQGQLTASVHAAEADETTAARLSLALQDKVGRIVWNGVPTGLEVCPSTQHGGPYPASTDSRFTSVGTDAVLRWVKPVCWQDAPQSVLPDELKDGNPMSIWRTVDGVLTKGLNV